MDAVRAGADLDERLRRLEDEEAIRELLTRYAFAVDLGRTDDFLGLWTDDCTFRTDGAGPATFSGKEEIRAYLELGVAAVPPLIGRIQHLLLDHVIEVDGDSARATGFQVVTRNTGAGFELYRTSYRTFELRRSDRRWLIREAVSIETGAPEQGGMIPTEDHWLRSQTPERGRSG